MLDTPNSERQSANQDMTMVPLVPAPEEELPEEGDEEGVEAGAATAEEALRVQVGAARASGKKARREISMMEKRM